MEPVGGYPYQEIEFNGEGQSSRRSDIDRFISESPWRGITDLFVFCHGWNNEPWKARRLYDDFFDKVRDVHAARGARSGVNIGVAGVIWPSILFPDDEPVRTSGGAVAIDEAEPASDAIGELRKAFPDKAMALDELGRMLEKQPDSQEALRRFQELLRELAPAESTAEDSGERALLFNEPEQVFEAVDRGIKRQQYWRH